MLHRNFDGLVKSLQTSFNVILAKLVPDSDQGAGIQCFQEVLDACLRRHDEILDFLRIYQGWILKGWGLNPSETDFAKIT